MPDHHIPDGQVPGLKQNRTAKDDGAQQNKGHTACARLQLRAKKNRTAAA